MWFRNPVAARHAVPWEKADQARKQWMREYDSLVTTLPLSSALGTHIPQSDEDIIYFLPGYCDTNMGEKIYPLDPNMTVLTEPNMGTGLESKYLQFCDCS